MIVIAIGQGLLSITAYLDAYYQVEPRTAEYGNLIPLRQFDTKNREFRVAAAQVDINYKQGNFAALVSPWIGDNSDVLERTNPKHNDVLDHFAQAYVTVERLDVGKFYSWCGYESPESRLSDCYSRGLLYTLAEPVWHFGLRYAWNLNPGWNGSFYLVPAWNQSESPTESVGAAAQIHRKFGSATDVTIGYMRSEEGDSSPNAFGGYGGIGFPKPGSSRVGMFDLIATHVASKSLRLVFNADYGMASEGANSGVWLGAAAYAIYTTADKWQIVGRAESFADRSGNRVGVPASLFEVTLTVSHNSDGIIKRLEIRHDRANHGLFAGEDHQTTVSLSLGVTWQALR